MLIKSILKSKPGALAWVPFLKIHCGSVYVHWPYCRKRCSYCNFNKYILQSSIGVQGRKSPWIVPEKRMVDALLTELRSLSRISGIQKVKSIYFGGGTPSLMNPESINLIVEELKAKTSDNVEVTLEANPEDLTSLPCKLSRFKEAGINRISLGVQAFNASDLLEMNRAHGLQDSFKAIEDSIKVFGEHRLSLDLIFGRNQFQRLDSWMKELNVALSYGVEHLSLYQLTVERGTPLWKDRMKRPSFAPEEDVVNQMYFESVGKLKAHGYHRYEVSNFATRPSTQSRHNCHYWEGGEYIGIGPGAHGRFVVRSEESNHHSNARDIIQNRVKEFSLSSSRSKQERVQTLEPHEWVREVEMVGHGTRRANPLSLLDSCIELLGSGLRTANGVQAGRWKELCSENSTLEDLVSHSSETRRMALDGLIRCSSESLSLSENGMNVADYIASHIVSNLINLQNDVIK